MRRLKHERKILGSIFVMGLIGIAVGCESAPVGPGVPGNTAAQIPGYNPYAVPAGCVPVDGPVQFVGKIFSDEDTSTGTGTFVGGRMPGKRWETNFVTDIWPDPNFQVDTYEDGGPTSFDSITVGSAGNQFVQNDSRHGTIKLNVSRLAPVGDMRQFENAWSVTGSVTLSSANVDEVYRSFSMMRNGPVKVCVSTLGVSIKYDWNNKALLAGRVYFYLYSSGNPYKTVQTVKFVPFDDNYYN